MSRCSGNNKKWLVGVFLVVILLVIYYFSGDKASVPQPQTTETAGSSASEVIPTEKKPTATVQGISTQTPDNIYYEIHFTNPVDPNDRSVEESLISKIDNAKESIDLAVYEFDIEAVAQAIIRAENRGVIVRVVYDNDYCDPDPQIGELKSAGIPAIPDNRSAYMHDKFFVFDHACVWTGSFNITNNASRKNNENAIYFCSPEASANYSTEFAEMFAGKFGASSPSDTPYPTFVINGHTVENCFAAEDGCMKKVITAVDTAKTSVHFMAFEFTDDNLKDAMIADGDRGVSIEGIFESRYASANYSECTPLLQKGYDIRLDGNKNTFHHKVIIIDGETVIFGSFNFTASADKKNDENLLIWHDPGLASAFEQQYQLMKSQATVPSKGVCD